MEDVIVVDGLRKTFRTPFRQKKVEAVKSVSFTVGRGEIFGFLGPNGAGKTTTIKVLTGLVRASAGFVSVLGGRPDDIAVKARIGFLPEQPYFYDYLTPRELLDVFGRLFGMPRDRRKRRIGELLEQVGLGYASDRTLRKFSKGMLQRVGIAQALLNDPELVILDEPMSGLDPIGHREVIDLIAALKARGATVFFSSHILADVERLCDRVAVLDRGLMKATGSLDALLGGTSDEKEVVLRGAPAPVADGTWPGLRSVGTIGSGAVRCVVRDVATDAFVSKALEAGLSLVTVTERRMTLEELVVGPVAGQGVAAGA